MFQLPYDIKRSDFSIKYICSRYFLKKIISSAFEKNLAKDTYPKFATFWNKSCLLCNNKRGLCFNALETLFVYVGIPTQVMREAAVKICTFHRSILPLATTNWDLLSSGGALLNIKVWDENTEQNWIEKLSEFE